MTVVASIATRNMRWMFACRYHAIVTRAANANYLCVVDRKRGRKHVGVVAVIADIACLDMRRVLTGSLRAIMAVDAITRDVQVIEIRR